MGAVLGFLRLLVSSWLARDRTVTSQSRRRRSRRRTVTSAAAAVAMIVRSVAVTVVLTGTGPLVLAWIEVWVTLVRF